ncbi:MAG: hypothetical protein P0Y49_15780 [Candidatus Pedobacter colombiensis]|uniref:Uncharacterized protein n=1 Tax=Candidatus Pedobacter colombiensis TaxID=3121371 RepID=A0AAJ5W6T0_9SPHI|nr:hypothetical protein [Pedobacter sp.]WEK18251.1 MAG: hypothetical protein P0Y49_15780 [Pedobacter sp.]
MNRNYYLFIMLLIASIVTSCKKSDIAYENGFDKSYKAWLAFKASSNNSYRYKVYTSSWTGFSSETTITVKDGKVVERVYIAKTVERPSNQIVVHEEWTEDVNSLNTHPNGYSTFTLDEIYNKAKTEWLLKRKDADVSLETKNNGMISSCGYVPKNCVDDCFFGISITSIMPLIAYD